MKNLDIIIRKVEAKDSQNIFELSNSDYVRENSIDSSHILWENHQSWFSQHINNDNCFFYIITTSDNEFVGQIRYDIDFDNSCIVNISLKDKFQYKGLGTKVLLDSIYKIKKENVKIRKIIAYISISNLNSIKLFKKIGFSFIREIVKNNKVFKKFVLRI